MNKAHLFSSRIALCRARLFSSMMLMIAATATSWAAQPGEFVVHHVRLEGTAFEKNHQELFEFVDQGCRAKGTPPESIPAGEKIFQIVKDIYYAVGGVTSYDKTKMYGINPHTCKLEIKEETKITMRTATGTCKIDPQRKRAVGWCDVQSLIAGKPEPAVNNISTKPTGGTMTIAGVKCDVLAGSMQQLNKEYCLAKAGSFAGMSYISHLGRSGVLLKDTQWLSNQPGQKLLELEATHVTLDTTVKLEVLAPHTVGGYTVQSQNGVKK